MKKSTSPNPELDIVIQSSEIAHQNPYYFVRHDRVTINDVPGEYWTLMKPVGSVFMVAEQDQKVLLIHQYRYSTQCWKYEFPAGSLLPGEDPLVGAQRELLEETGYTARENEVIGVNYAIPGISNIQHTTVVLRGLHMVAHAREATEHIASVDFYTIDEIKSMITSGDMVDGPSIVALMHYCVWKETI